MAGVNEYWQYTSSEGGEWKYWPGDMPLPTVDDLSRAERTRDENMCKCVVWRGMRISSIQKVRPTARWDAVNGVTDGEMT